MRISVLPFFALSIAGSHQAGLKISIASVRNVLEMLGGFMEQRHHTPAMQIGSSNEH